MSITSLRSAPLHLSFLNRSLFLFLLAASVLGIGAPAFAETVKELDVKGNRRIEKAAILIRLVTQVGSKLDLAVVEEDIRQIFKLGYFEDIEVDSSRVKGGVKLTYIVREKPTIDKVVYEGFDDLDKDERRELVGIRRFQVLDVHKLNLAVDRMTDKYEEKGYYLADVRYRIDVNDEAGTAVVTFECEENDKIKVRTVNIIGNKAISDAELTGVMQTQAGGFFSFITGSGTYREAVFQRDIAAMNFYYGTLGYVRARFGKPEVTVSPDKRWINITFYVEEGEQYSVGKVDFKGDLLYRRQELLDDLKLVEGEIFNTDTLRRETLRYTEKYSDLGYAFANVVPQPRVHDDTKTVDVTFDVDKGERVYVGHITIVGNTKTKDKVIRRELLIREGELYNGSKRRLSRANVIRLGFFDAVEFHQTSSKDDPQVLDIEIRVKERSTGQLVVGAGYASGNIGFTANAQLAQNNFLGNGQVASLRANILTGQQVYDFNLSFTEPRVGSSLWSLGGDLYHIRRILTAIATVPTFEEKKTGTKIRLGHPVLEYTNLFLTYKLENADVDPSTIIDRTLIAPGDVNGVTSSLTASLIYDKRDDRFDPRNGLFAEISSELAGIGTPRKFVKTRGTLKFFHPIIGDLVFRSQLTAANVFAFGGASVPVNEYFILGGLSSLRGYKFLSVGPTARLSNDLNDLSAAAQSYAGQEIVIGGTNEVMMNLEIEFPILKEARIRGVIFMDTGNTFNGFFDGRQPALVTNVGYGIRWFTPIGPLRFEFGYPIVNGGSPEFQFTIGPPF